MAARYTPEQKAFGAGVVYAAGYIATDCDQPTMAVELLQAIGVETRRQAFATGADKYDVDKCGPAFRDPHMKHSRAPSPTLKDTTNASK